MKSLHLIVVGKLKDKYLESLENDYLKRIKKPKLQIHEIKASAENKDQEAQVVLKKIAALSENHFVVVLTEFGEEFQSPQFSSWLYENFNSGKDLIFVVCGAEGPGAELLKNCDAKLSLSKLTFPHKLARLIFVEQIYRAQTIKDGHPYHN